MQPTICDWNRKSLRSRLWINNSRKLLLYTVNCWVIDFFPHRLQSTLLLPSIFIYSMLWNHSMTQSFQSTVFKWKSNHMNSTTNTSKEKYTSSNVHLLQFKMMMALLRRVYDILYRIKMKTMSTRFFVINFSFPFFFVATSTLSQYSLVLFSRLFCSLNSFFSLFIFRLQPHKDYV